ncbi:DUF6907 domain-containing protein [Sphaerisporangium sp. NPDC004334]
MNQRKGVNADASTPATTTTYDRPYWLTQPCPTWCTTGHRASDSPDDRLHESDTRSVPLILEQAEQFGPYAEPPVYRYSPPSLMASLLQDVREAGPVVELHDNRDAYTVRVTLDEAAEFGADLIELAITGRVTTQPSAPGGAAECQPWCTRHDPDVPELCTGDDEIVPLARQGDARIGLTHTPDDGTVIEVDGHLYGSVDEAEALVVALLRQIGRARKGQP